MSYKISVLQKEKQVGDLLLKYTLFKKDETIEDNIVTTFDAEVVKVKDSIVETAICPSISSDLDIATTIVDILYRNDVLPETLLEVIEECLELV